jgi:hypothetical protein
LEKNFITKAFENMEIKEFYTGLNGNFPISGERFHNS